jgi:hypothetical protein
MAVVNSSGPELRRAVRGGVADASNNRGWTYRTFVNQDFDAPSPPFIPNDIVEVTAHVLCGTP